VGRGGGRGAGGYNRDRFERDRADRDQQGGGGLPQLPGPQQSARPGHFNQQGDGDAARAAKRARWVKRVQGAF
jgi:hypothetical protein